MRNKLIIVRGIPGSGKSTFAKRLSKKIGGCHYEADDFFQHGTEYRFDPSLLKEAHNTCLDNVTNALEEGKTCIVANTFVKRWEAKKYIDVAARLNLAVKIFRMTGDYGSVHSVPSHVVDRMRDNFEDFTQEVLV